MVYDRVDNNDKFSKKNFGLGRLRFHATALVIINHFCCIVYLQGMSMVAEGCHSEKKNNNNKKRSMFQKNFVYKKIINKVNLLRL